MAKSKKATVGASIRGKGGPSKSGDVPGGPGHSFKQKPYAGPENPGMPASMKKALKRK